MKDLRGRTAIVTGASRGVGVYEARALAREGMNLVLAARDATGLDACRKEVEALGVRSISVRIDLREPAAPHDLVRRAEQAFGDIDVLVNNAGIEDIGVVEAIDPQSILDSIAVNLTAPILLARLVLPGMLARDRGHIVNIASLAGLAPNAYSEVYAATKHGLVGFTRSLRATADGERKKSQVGFSSICPGFISTIGMAEEMRVKYGVVPPAILGVSHPEKVARAVVKAIRTNAPEVIVNPGPMRPLLAIATLSPGFGEWFTRVFSLHEVFRLSAKARRKGRS